MHPLASDTRLARVPDLLSTEFQQETVLMSLSAGRYYGLEGTARRVWELLATPSTPAELQAALEAEYDVPAAGCEADVRAFLEDLLREGMVVRVP